jgi:hypothetical protein
LKYKKTQMGKKNSYDSQRAVATIYMLLAQSSHF